MVSSRTWTTEAAPRQMAALRLRQSAYPALRGVSCEFADGVLSLHGSVSSYYLKQLAQSLVFRLEGVSTLQNCLEVRAS